MGDMGEMFKALRSAKQEQRFRNRVNGKIALMENGIPYKSCSDSHLQITTDGGVINFYPSTGLWFYTDSNLRHRGVKKLIQHYFDIQFGGYNDIQN